MFFMGESEPPPLKLTDKKVIFSSRRAHIQFWAVSNKLRCYFRCIGVQCSRA
eukprot:UN22639